MSRSFIVRGTGPRRRELLALAGIGAAAALAGRPGRLSAAGHDQPKTDLTPDQALERLRAGNARFVADPEVCTADLAGRRRAVAASQAPWATVIACADSRVPPELLFGGLGLGELFVARNAGNLADQATLGTVEYGAARPGLAADRGPGPHPLRCRRSRLRRGHRARHLPRRHRPDD